jgi:hypothetical protein
MTEQISEWKRTLSPAKASLYDNLPEGGHLPDGA